MEIKKIALTIGIAVLFTLFIVFLVDAIYSYPKYEDYCIPQFYPAPVAKLGINCTSVYNESLANQCFKDQGEMRYKYDSEGCEKEMYCDPCSKEYNTKNSTYNKNIFYISALIALISILVGLYLPKNLDAIASGFVFGGILVLLQGTARVFGDLGKVSKVIVLGIELIILIWIGYKKVSDKPIKKKT